MWICGENVFDKSSNSAVFPCDLKMVSTENTETKTNKKGWWFQWFQWGAWGGLEVVLWSLLDVAKPLDS